MERENISKAPKETELYQKASRDHTSVGDPETLPAAPKKTDVTLSPRHIVETMAQSN